MVAELENRITEKNKFELIPKDVLSCELPSFDYIVSNIPFEISSPLLLKILKETKLNFKSVVLLLQYEFAQRLFAMFIYTFSLGQVPQIILGYQF